MTNILINPSITNCFSVDVESFTEANFPTIEILKEKQLLEVN